MTIFLCATCGTSFPQSAAPPDRCPICDEERQYVPPSGQAWTSREALERAHRNAWRLYEKGLFSLQPVPAFAINQRAFLVKTGSGNVLWDCVSLLDAATKVLVDALGGLVGIAISHPHYYTVMHDWAEAFDVPVYLHAADREWVMRPHRNIEWWEGDSKGIAADVTLVRAGGHFSGGTVLHWTGATDGNGVLLAGDIVQITPGGRRVSFMWSYPNMLPLPAAAVRTVAARLSPLRYERIYGAFLGQDILADGSGIVARSAARYIDLLEGPPPG